MAKERKKRVSWTPEETERVIQEAVLLYLFSNEYVWSFMAKAQKNVLPVDRQKNIVGRSNINISHLERFNEIRDESFDQTAYKQVDTESPPKEPPTSKLTREDVLRSITTEELLILLAPRLASIMDAIPTLLQGKRQPVDATPLQAEQEKISTPATCPTVRKVKVLLCEFLPGQETVIREKARDFNLELVFQPKSVRPMKGTAPSCQWCICMNKRGHIKTNSLHKSGYSKIVVVSGIESALKALADINSKVCRTPAQ